MRLPETGHYGNRTAGPEPKEKPCAINGLRSDHCSRPGNNRALKSVLNSHIVRGSKFARHVAGVFDPPRLDNEELYFPLRKGLMLYPFRHYVHFTGIERDGTIAEIDA